MSPGESQVSSRLRDQFEKEAAERLKDLENGLLNMEQSLDPEANIRLIFRGFHGLKGMSGYFDAREIIDLSNAGETLLTQVRDEGVAFRTEWVDILLGCHDELKALVKAFLTGGDPGDSWRRRLEEIRGIIESNRTGTGKDSERPVGGNLFLDTADAQIRGLEVYLRKWKPGPADPRLLSALARKLRLISTAAGSAGREDVVRLLADHIERLERLRGETCSAGVIEDFAQVTSKLRNLVGEPGKPPSVETETASKQPPEPAARHLEIKAEYVEMLEDLVDDFSMYARGVSQNLKRLKPSVKPVALSWLAGLESDLKRFAGAFSKSCRRLHLVPLSTLLEGLPRLVRDVARRDSKKVKLVMEGGEVELEKDQVEKLHEPLTHLVRNAVDHGLETPEDRVRNQKPETGTLTVRAYADKGSVTVEVIDDGKGIDFDAIRNKAAEMGLLPAEKAAAARPEDLMDLVFLSGLSTKLTANTISGRGVGMDIVREALKGLRGKVEIDSVPGRGTTVRLTIPWELDD